MFQGNYLLISVAPGDYTPIHPEAYEVVEGFSRNVVKVATRRIGFEVTFRDSRDEYFQILNQLQLAQEAVPGQFTPATVLDYCRPNPADTAQGYSVRTGQLVVTPLTGTMRIAGNPATRLNYGLTITLLPI
jgi:hypothetical protein